MRLWSIHPANLDRVGLIALWRETLLAIAVLEGKTKGYKHHPQLERFRNQPDCIYWYAWQVAQEMKERGYKPDTSKLKLLESLPHPKPIKVSMGQVRYEGTLVGLKIANRYKPTHDARFPLEYRVIVCYVFEVDWEDETIATWERPK